MDNQADNMVEGEGMWLIGKLLLSMSSLSVVGLNTVVGLLIIVAHIFFSMTSVVTVIEIGTEIAVFSNTEPNQNQGFMPLSVDGFTNGAALVLP